MGLGESFVKKTEDGNDGIRMKFRVILNEISKVIASEFRVLSCTLMKGLASMIQNREFNCDNTDNEMLSLNDVLM